MKQDLELNGELSQITLRSSMNDVAENGVNTLELQHFSGEWSGRYYTDYPITLKCKVQEGYTFAGWESEGRLLSSDEQLVLDLEHEGMTVTAIIEMAN